LLLRQATGELWRRFHSHISTSVPGSVREAPSTFRLYDNYPNPFNPSTTIEFTLPHAGFATLKVYNILGEEVATLIAKEHPAGTFKTAWDASRVSSGTYLYRLTAGNLVQTKRMLLVR
jgi:hypothetical protein